MSLAEEVFHLISLQQEGGYWDFKKQWHEDKGDLLHDIICMANNLHNRTAYIIIGIDEEQEYTFVDVKNDPYRKNTQKIVDFLKDKEFIGGVRPLVHVEQILLSCGSLDVIVIENSYNTPFYLAERFQGVRANHIYTRVMDTNTPIDKSADINNVEYLWRKRFHLNETPMDKFNHYLKSPDDWAPLQDYDMGYFYKFAPEYTMVCEADDRRDGYEYYLFGQVNSKPSWWLITLRYHQTSISQRLGISLDGGRSFVVAPERAFEALTKGISCFGYYIRETLAFRLLEFFHGKETTDEYAFRAYMRAVVVFHSELEYKYFWDYLISNREHYHDLCMQQGDTGLPSFPKLDGYNMNEYKKEYRDALVMRKMLEEFRYETAGG